MQHLTKILRGRACVVAAVPLLAVILVFTSCSSVDRTGGKADGGAAVGRFPDAREYYLDGGDTGIMIVHGYSCSSLAFLHMAGELNELGYTVFVLLLPGHGTKVEDLDHVAKQDYYDYLDKKYREFSKKVDKVYVLGHSLGALLTMNLAVHEPKLDGVIVMSAPILDFKKDLDPKNIEHLVNVMLMFTTKLPRPNPRYLIDKDFFDRYKIYRDISSKGVEVLVEIIEESQDFVSKISQPILVLQGKHDFLVSSESARFIYDNVKSEMKELLYVNTMTHRLYFSEKLPEIIGAIDKFIKASGGGLPAKSGSR